MAVFGNPSVGPDGFPSSDGRVLLGRFTLTEDGDTNFLAVHAGAAGAGNLRALIYADNGGAPGALLAAGPSTAAASGAPAWRTLPVSVSLPAGTYWLGVTSSGFYAQYTQTPSGGASAFLSGTNFASPPNPLGTPQGTGTQLMSVYCDYEPAGGPPAGDMAGSTAVAFAATGTISATGPVNIAGSASMSFSVSGRVPATTFGWTEASTGGVWPSSGGRAIASRAVLEDPASTRHFHQHFGTGGAAGTTTPGRSWVGLVYADDNGEPGALLAASELGTTVEGGGWHSAPITIELAPGPYWLATLVSEFGVAINSATPPEGGAVGGVRRGEGMGSPAAPGAVWSTASTNDGTLDAYISYVAPAPPAGELQGSTSFAFAAAGTPAASAALAGASSVAFAPLGALRATIAAAGATGLSFDAAGALAARAPLAGAAAVTFTATGTASGGSTLAGAAVVTFTATATIAARAALAGAGTITFTATGASGSSASLAGASAFEFAATGAPGARVALSATTDLTFAAAATAAGRGALAGSAALSFTTTGTAGVDWPTGRAEFGFSAAGTLAGTAALAGASTVGFTAAGALQAPGALAGSTSLAFTVAGDARTDARLSGHAGVTFTPDASIGGVAALSGTARLTFEVWLYTADPFDCPPEIVVLAPFPEVLGPVTLAAERLHVTLPAPTTDEATVGDERIEVVRHC